jgi:hydroxyacylglutathione hydrolase
MNLTALPAFTDNYIWMLHEGANALVVDPGDAAPVLAALSRLGLTLTAILVTHRHADHVAGLPRLQTDAGPAIPVYGPRHEAIDGITHQVGDGDVVAWENLQFRVMDVPGHTAGHIAYLIDRGADPALSAPVAFVGDTLFSGGCGRLFDGSMEQLFDSLSRLRGLPDDTLICAAHEYTLSNLRFAKAVEPHNSELDAYTSRCEALRARHQPTLPGILGTEKAINPFLRCTEPEVIASALRHGARDESPQAVFAALRQWKNSF